MSPRFVVGETRGYRITAGKVGGKPRSTTPPGAGYAVIDTHVLHRCMGEFASEDRDRQSTLGHAGARAKAQELADRLNAEEAAGWPTWPTGKAVPPPTRLTLPDKVVALLADGPMTTHDLVAALGIKQKHFSKMMWRDLLGKRVERVTRGVYRVIE